MQISEGFEIVLPVPPSANNLFFNLPKHGRAKTRAYISWLEGADTHYYIAKLNKVRPITGPCELKIFIPVNKRRDLSNHIKPIEDWLVSRGLTADDRNNRKITVEQDLELPRHLCRVEVTPA